MKFQCFCSQNRFKNEFTSLALVAKVLLSVRIIRPDMTTVVFGRVLLIDFAKEIISSAQLAEVSFALRLLVPTCIINLSDFFRKMGLIWSSISSVVQPENVDTCTLDFLVDILSQL